MSIGSLLGSGEVVCRVIAADISVHWFATGATTCLCGETTRERRKPGGQPGRRLRGLWPACGKNVAVHQGLAWYHYPPGRGHPNCEGVNQPVKPVRR